MPRYQIEIAGGNFLMRFDPAHRPAKHGFYTQFFLEADSVSAAEGAVLDLLRRDPSISGNLNAPDDPPTFEVETICEIAEWPDCPRPRIGLAWFSEDSDDTK